MHITAILGSARKHGNTAAVLAMFEARVGTPHSLERINLAEYSIEDCRGCDACQRKAGRPGCSRKEDAEIILQKILRSYLVVYASPVFM